MSGMLCAVLRRRAALACCAVMARRRCSGVFSPGGSWRVCTSESLDVCSATWAFQRLLFFSSYNTAVRDVGQNGVFVRGLPIRC